MQNFGFGITEKIWARIVRAELSFASFEGSAIKLIGDAEYINLDREAVRAPHVRAE